MTKPQITDEERRRAYDSCFSIASRGTGASKPPSVVDVDEVFSALDKSRASGDLTRQLRSKHPFLFRSSTEYPGLVERIDRAGAVTVGLVQGGRFICRVERID